MTTCYIHKMHNLEIKEDILIFISESNYRLENNVIIVGEPHSAVPMRRQ